MNYDKVLFVGKKSSIDNVELVLKFPQEVIC